MNKMDCDGIGRSTTGGKGIITPNDLFWGVLFMLFYILVPECLIYFD